MGLNDFAADSKKYLSFVVRNITPDSNKTIKIFNYPILFNQTRDILAIPGIAEQEIRASLLKGELRHKILAGDIVIEQSDIDLLQFNLGQRDFLQSAGVDFGLQIGTLQQSVVRKEDIILNGIVDDANLIFTIPSGTFIQDSLHKIIVYKNGVKQAIGDDFIIFEGGGPGTGYTGIIFTVAPSIVTQPNDLITADYYINNPL
jgi:hypothetical protein